MSDERAPSDTFAISPTRTVLPSDLARTMIFSNSSTVCRRPCVVMVIWNRASSVIGAPPTRPTAACTSAPGPP